MLSKVCAGIVLFAAAAAAQTFSGSAALDAAIEQAMRENVVPGAVTVAGHNGRIIHSRAYGKRTLVPNQEEMTADTIFDCASLTKVVATTSALMKLVEQGKLRLNDRVVEYLPEFQNGKSGITIRNLLTHFSGLRPDLDLEPAWSGYETGVRLALADKPVSSPGAKFVYSDINFILLGEIVRRLSGQTLPEFTRENVFAPLGMNDTMFNPPASLTGRIAPTEASKGLPPLRGVVHDPTARFMGGVAGHAGLFSTGADLARFAQAMLGRGAVDGVRVFSAATVEKFTEPQSPPDQFILRGFGWDIDSPFSSNRGELFPIGSYGHTGFTGTSMWMDPRSQTYVIFLSSRLHPSVRPTPNSLRSKVATIVAGAAGIAEPGVRLTGYNETLAGAGIHREVARNAEVRTGLDVLAAQGFAPLLGKKIGLITNHTGLDREGRRNIDRMREAGVQIDALYAPEHGFLGAEDHENIGHSKDPATGIKVWSLYSGPSRRPSPEMLRGIDVLVFDIQDIGARFYTYIATMAYGMEEAAKLGIPYYVLDRPNPITGIHVEGPLLDRGLESFVGYHSIPLRHGMTMGEMAKMFNVEKNLHADLHVIAMENWQRGDWFDSTGLIWVDPSPNMRGLAAAALYPGVAMLEYSKNYSVGRGTETPFEVVGASFIRGRELAAYLNQRFIPGLRVYPTKFKPSSASEAGHRIEGVRLIITDRQALDSGLVGLELAAALRKLYPGKIQFSANRKLIGNEDAIRRLEAGEDPRLIQQSMDQPLRDFLAVREKYLIYR